MIKGELAELIADHFSYVRISMDTFNPEIYKKIRRPKNKRYELETVLNNAKELIKLKKRKKAPIQIGVKVCLTRNNLFDIMETVEVAQKIGFNSIQIKVARHSGKKEISLDKLRKIKEQLDRAKQEFKDILVMGSTEKYKLDHKCWFCPIHLFIDCNGDVRLCCYYQFRQKRHTYGNVFLNSLEEVWYSKKHFEAIKNIRLEECNQWDCKYFTYNKVMKEAIIKDKAQWQFV
jgi:MoaA/NifB/PqqE/SkfB family radical SAM enzyme